MFKDGSIGRKWLGVDGVTKFGTKLGKSFDMSKLGAIVILYLRERDVQLLLKEREEFDSEEWLH